MSGGWGSPERGLPTRRPANPPRAQAGGTSRHGVGDGSNVDFGFRKRSVQPAMSTPTPKPASGVLAFEGFVAAWLALTYAMRLALDAYLFREGTQADRGPYAVLRAVGSLESLLFLLLGTPLLLVAISLRPDGLDRLQQWLKRLAAYLKETIKDWRTYAITVVLLAASAVIVQIRARLHPGEVKVWEQLPELVWGAVEEAALMLALAALAYVLWYAVHRVFRRRRDATTMAEALNVWTACGFFIVTAHVLALLTWHFGIRADAARQSAHPNAVFLGFVKDVTIYSVIAFFVAAGPMKFVGVLRKLPGGLAARLVLMFALVVVVAAVVPLAMDILFADEIGGDAKAQEAGRSPGRYHLRYPMAWQKEVMSVFVYGRDFGWLVPAIVVIHLYFWREAVKRNGP